MYMYTYRTIKANIFKPTTLYSIASNTASTAIWWREWYDETTTVEEVSTYDEKAITTIMTAFACCANYGDYSGEITFNLRSLDLDTLKDCRQDLLNALTGLHQMRYDMREDYGDNHYELTGAEEEWDIEIEEIGSLVDDINTEIDSYKDTFI